MRKTKDEIMSTIKEYLKEKTDDTTIQFLEDLSDSLIDDSDNWKTKYEENDKQWRERYKERFFSPSTKEDATKGIGETSTVEIGEDEVNHSQEKRIEYQSLFDVEKGGK